MQRKHWIRALLVVVALVAIGAVVRARFWPSAAAAPGGSAAPRGSGSGAPGAEDRVVSVVLAPVETRDMPLYLEGLGTVTAFNTVTVKPQVEGRLDKVAFEEGQDVKKGDLLAQIDPRSYTIQLHTAQAALARDTALLAGRRRTLDRDLGLQKEGVGTQQQVDDDRSGVEQAQATLKSDYAQIESARLLLDYARVTAPIDGVTGVRLVDAGNVVRPSDATGLVVITQIDPIAVIFSLPQDDFAAISKEMAAGPLTVETLSRDGDARLAAGKLTLVDNQINAQTATIRLKAVFPNADRSLWPNQFVKARLLLTTRKGARVVPASSIQRGPQGMFVYVVGADQKAAVRPVQVERTEGYLAVVVGGLEAGEQVVTDGQFQLRPGSRVAPKPPGSASPSAGPKGSGAPSAPPSAPPHMPAVPASGTPAAPPASGSAGPSR